MTSTDLYRELPSVESLRLDPALAFWLERLAPEFVVAVIQRCVADARGRLDTNALRPNRSKIIAQVNAQLNELTAPTLRRVINGTGIVLHTGLGRAPLAREASEALLEAAGYCNVELDLKTGERGDRQSHVEHLLTLLSGAEAALVVNNNAAALYLALNTLGFAKEVVVSRGQLIEIGGSFRLPEIMRRAGVRLVEVGTTNRTRIADYREAVTKKTALLLRAYPSNYRIDGFTESVSIGDLVQVGKECGLPVVDDLGGGLMWDWTAHGLPYEPTVRESLTAGADLVLVSGDKAVGGPQAGVILGRREWVQKLKRAPLARVVRPEKLILAALSATLRLYLLSHGPRQNVPSWQMLTASVEVLQSHAEDIVNRMKTLGHWSTLETRRCESETGSGTLPAVGIPSVAVCSLPLNFTAAKWAAAFRSASTPVVGTVREDLLWLDVRTISPSEVPLLVQSAREVLAS